MDSACSINKNFYILGWASKMVQQGKFDYIRILFFIAGHIKFAPDVLFSKVFLSFSKSDGFTTIKLGDIAGRYSSVVIDEGDLVFQWQSSLATKYSALPGIHDLHYFVIVSPSWVER